MSIIDSQVGLCGFSKLPRRQFPSRSTLRRITLPIPALLTLTMAACRHRHPNIESLTLTTDNTLSPAFCWPPMRFDLSRTQWVRGPRTCCAIGWVILINAYSLVLLYDRLQECLVGSACCQPLNVSCTESWLCVSSA
jgi:hypothetical protein